MLIDPFNIRLLRLALLLALVLMIGCGGQEKVESYDAYFEELLGQIDQLADKLESIDNAESALREAGEIGELSTKLSQKLGQSSNLPKADSLTGLKIKQRFEELWEPRLKVAFERLDVAASGVVKRTNQDNVPRRVQQQLKRLQRQIQGFRKGLQAALGEQAEQESQD